LKPPPDNLRRVGLVTNTVKPSAVKLLKTAAEWFRRRGSEVLVDQSTADAAGSPGRVLPDLKALGREAQLLVVFGGDGTILRVARGLDGAKLPIVGVNAGRLGFLTDVPAHQLDQALQKIWEGRVQVETRPLIDVTVRAGGREQRFRALNDVTITRGAESRMIELDVRVDGDTLTHYRSDGLIISSPTGSTAYSLSAGGPIVHPTAKVFALTPICPHTLSNRSVIVSFDSKIEVKALTPKMAMVATADGQVSVEIRQGDTLTVRRSRRSVRLLHLEGTSFFDTLRRKLHWSGSNT
jgi:NAD+ kinase